MTTLHLDIDLRKNRILNAETEGFEDLNRTPEARVDYRKTLISSVISYAVESDRDRVIQQMLPERLAVCLDNIGELTISFDVYVASELSRCKLKAEKNGELTKLTIEIGAEAGGNNSGARSLKKVLLIKLGDEEEGSLRKWLGESYELISLEAAGEASDLTDNSDSECLCAILAYSEDFEPDCRILVSAGVPVIAAADDEHIDAALRAGAFDVFRRPLLPSETKERIAHILERRNTHNRVSLLERDSLTGLYVGATFYRKAEEMLKAYGKEIAVILFNIEDFQFLGEKYGKAVLDMTMKYVSGRIQCCFPNIILAGRISSSEIAVLGEKLPLDSYTKIIAQITDGAPVSDLILKAGISLVNPAAPIEMNCARARTALEKIHKVYSVSAAEYDNLMDKRSTEELQILRSMESALENKQFKVFYQPKVDTVTGKTVGAEALVRWYHPELGNISPARFIPLFERVGFIRGLDRYIWTRVIMDIAERKASGLPVVPVSVNMSRRDFEAGGLPEWFTETCARYGVEHSLLHLEITESALTSDIQRISEDIHRLHEEGFIIELDDFGTGYTSLMCINDFDIDVLKIDRSIVQNEMKNSGRDVLSFCIKLAKMMGMTTVIEGVETENQYRRVLSLGGDRIQGFYFSQPLPVEEFDLYLKRNC